MSLKASDYSCIPLCYQHHRGNTDCYHAGKGNFEQIHSIDCRAVVRRLNSVWSKYPSAGHKLPNREPIEGL